MELMAEHWLKIQQLFESAHEVISEGSRRARKEKGPEAGRRRAGDFADGPLGREGNLSFSN
jgi:hypothetical protein